MEVLYPISEVVDENVGGGRSNVVSKPTEMKALRIADDRYLNQLKKQKYAVEQALNNSDSVTCNVIELYYMDDKPKTWDMVSFELYNGQISTRTLKRIRTAFFEKVGTYLGWLV